MSEHESEKHFTQEQLDAIVKDRLQRAAESTEKKVAEAVEKATAELKSKVKEYEDAQLTEVQKAQADIEAKAAELEAANKRIRDMERSAKVSTMLTEAGLKPELARLIVGDTDEELTQAIETIKGAIPAAASAGVPPTEPDGDPAPDIDPFMEEMKRGL
jgi:Asp-tRNA(Asn)/Glu-tRNA(Gln) amidotransferase A subunit family amidase